MSRHETTKDSTSTTTAESSHYTYPRWTSVLAILLVGTSLDLAANEVNSVNPHFLIPFTGYGALFRITAIAMFAACNTRWPRTAISWILMGLLGIACYELAFRLNPQRPPCDILSWSKWDRLKWVWGLSWGSLTRK